MDQSQAVAMFRKKFEMYKKIMDEKGEAKAWEELFKGYPERQKQNLGKFIDNASLAEGFSKSVEMYKQFGMEMQVVDISNRGMDGVLEIQRVCPVLTVSKEYGFEKPCHIICEMDVEATKKAFPGTSGEILARQADGACVCIFKYERKTK